MFARRRAVERSEILDGHRSEGYGNLGGSDPCHNGSLQPLIVFWPRSVFLPSLLHLSALSVSYLHARVTPEVKSPGKDVSSELFAATFTG
jgi:hypothetical protein